MDEDAIIRYITDTFDGVDIVVASDDSYFVYDPGRRLDPARRMPFATIVTGDRHDDVSDLDRPAVFRLNVGVGRETFRSLFGPQTSPTDAGGAGVVERGPDFAALDRIMPHPVYGRMFWVCVLNPSAATF